MSERISQSQIFLIGGGGHAMVVFEAARLAGVDVAGFFDDRANGSLLHLVSTHLGPLSQIDDYAVEHRVPGILAVGSLSFRNDLLDRFAVDFATVIHPLAVVSSKASIQNGCFVSACAVISANTSVGCACIVNTRAVVEHDCRIGNNVHIGPGAVMGGGVTVGENTLIGLNSTVNPGITIGRDCVVGSGAVVVCDVNDGETVMGVPAKPMRHTDHLRSA